MIFKFVLSANTNAHTIHPRKKEKEKEKEISLGWITVTWEIVLRCKSKGLESWVKTLVF